MLGHCHVFLRGKKKDAAESKPPCRGALKLFSYLYEDVCFTDWDSMGFITIKNHHPHRSESQIGIRVAPVSAKWRVHMQAQTIPSQKFHIDTQNRSFLFKEVTNFQGPSVWGIWLLAPILSQPFVPRSFIWKSVFFFNPFQHGGSSCLQKSKHVFFCFPGGFVVIKTFSSCELDVSDVFVRFNNH